MKASKYLSSFMICMFMLTPQKAFAILNFADVILLYPFVSAIASSLNNNPGAFSIFSNPNSFINQTRAAGAPEESDWDAVTRIGQSRQLASSTAAVAGIQAPQQRPVRPISLINPRQPHTVIGGIGGIADAVLGLGDTVADSAGHLGAVAIHTGDKMESIINNGLNKIDLLSSTTINVSAILASTILAFTVCRYVLYPYLMTRLKEREANKDIQDSGFLSFEVTNTLNPKSNEPSDSPAQLLFLNVDQGEALIKQKSIIESWNTKRPQLAQPIHFGSIDTDHILDIAQFMSNYFKAEVKVLSADALFLNPKVGLRALTNSIKWAQSKAMGKNKGYLYSNSPRVLVITGVKKMHELAEDTVELKNLHAARREVVLAMEYLIGSKTLDFALSTID